MAMPDLRVIALRDERPLDPTTLQDAQQAIDDAVLYDLSGASRSVLDQTTLVELYVEYDEHCARLGVEPVPITGARIALFVEWIEPERQASAHRGLAELAEACRRALPAAVADALDRTVPPRLTSTSSHAVVSPSLPSAEWRSDSSDATSVEDGYAIPTTLDDFVHVLEAVETSIHHDDEAEDASEERYMEAAALLERAIVSGGAKTTIENRRREYKRYLDALAELKLTALPVDARRICLALGVTLEPARFLATPPRGAQAHGWRGTLEKLNQTMQLLARSMTALWPRQNLLDARYDALIADLIARGRTPAAKRSPWAYVEEQPPLAQPLMVPRVRVDYDESKMDRSLSQLSAESVRPKKRKKVSGEASPASATRPPDPSPSAAPAVAPPRRRAPSPSPPPEPGPATFSTILGRTLRGVAAIIDTGHSPPPEVLACTRVEDVLDAIDRLRRTWVAEDTADG